MKPYIQVRKDNQTLVERIVTEVLEKYYLNTVGFGPRPRKLKIQQHRNPGAFVQLTPAKKTSSGFHYYDHPREFFWQIRVCPHWLQLAERQQHVYQGSSVNPKLVLNRWTTKLGYGEDALWAMHVLTDINEKDAQVVTIYHAEFAGVVQSSTVSFKRALENCAEHYRRAMTGEEPPIPF